jgi:iron(III) transport system substrate-binding protein
MRSLARSFLLWAALAGPALAEAMDYPAPVPGKQRLLIYSTLDNRLAAPLIALFQASHPDVTVRYEDLLAGEIAARVIAETDAGQPTADFIFSSAMDLQLKLANDGYAQPAAVPGARRWPAWIPHSPLPSSLLSLSTTNPASHWAHRNHGWSCWTGLLMLLAA